MYYCICSSLYFPLTINGIKKKSCFTCSLCNVCPDCNRAISCNKDGIVLVQKKKKKKNLALPLSKIPVTLYPLLQVVFGLAKLRWIARASNIIYIFKLHFTTSSYIIIDVTSHGIDFYRVLKIRSYFFFFFFFFFLSNMWFCKSQL
jgi:hypothetical protein